MHPEILMLLDFAAGGVVPATETQVCGEITIVPQIAGRIEVGC